jgi:hypothetical protein
VLAQLIGAGPPACGNDFSLLRKGMGCPVRHKFGELSVDRPKRPVDRGSQG